MKEHNVIFDQTLHIVVHRDDIDSTKALLKEDYQFIQGFDDMDEAFDYAEEKNKEL